MIHVGITHAKDVNKLKLTIQNISAPALNIPLLNAKQKKNVILILINDLYLTV